MTRIAITGASGIGKTTLANAIGQRFGIPVLGEDLVTVTQAAQHYDKQFLNGDTAATADAMREYIRVCNEWMSERARLWQAHSEFVSDRCCFDILSRLLSGTAPKNEKVLVSLINECHRQSRRVELFVVPPISPWSMKTGVNESGLRRNTLFSNKLRTNSMVIGLLRQFSASPALLLPMSATTTDQRCEHVEQALQKKRTARKARATRGT